MIKQGVVVSIGNTLNVDILGLERVWLRRYSLLKELGYRHELILLVRDTSISYPDGYVDQFGNKVTFIGVVGDSRVSIDRSVKDYLVKLKKSCAGVFIIDDNPHDDLPITYNFCKLSGTQLRKFIHYDITNVSVYGSEALESLRSDVRYWVCNNHIVNELSNRGISALTAPAVYVKRGTSVADGDVKRYLMVGGTNPVKDMATAIRAFKELHASGKSHSTLSIYGVLQPEFLKLIEDCPLITYEGSVSEVPYGDYHGYISSSVSEAFANSCVEASGCGLDLLLRANPCHTGYLTSIGRSDSLFTNSSGLRNLLGSRSSGDYLPVDSAPIGVKFSKENVLDFYKNVIKF